jgi:hypothetical protein
LRYRIRRNYGPLFTIVLLVALAAPSEHLVDWREEASPAGKLIRHTRVVPMP